MDLERALISITIPRELSGEATFVGQCQAVKYAHTRAVRVYRPTALATYIQNALSFRCCKTAGDTDPFAAKWEAPTKAMVELRNERPQLDDRLMEQAARLFPR